MMGLCPLLNKGDYSAMKRFSVRILAVLAAAAMLLAGCTDDADSGMQWAKMGVLGEVQQSIDYDPSICIDLGAFYGDVPFKRTYRLKSRFEHDDLKLLQPQDNPLFNLSVKKTAPKTFEIEVTPKKLPLPTQRLREKFIIPVTGVDKFGPVAIAMKGYIIARKLMFTQRAIILKKEVTPVNYMPIELLTKDNVDFYRRTNVG